MKRLLFFINFLVCSMAFSSPKYEVKNIDFRKVDNIVKVHVDLTANSKLIYDGEIRDNILQVELKNTFVWPKIEKKKYISGLGEVQLVAYQYDSKTVRIRAITKKKFKTIGNNLSFSKGNKNIVGQVKLASSKENGIANERKYDESYLNKLLKDSKEQKGSVRKISDIKPKISKTDTISFLNSGNKKNIVDPLANPEPTNSRSGIYGYIFKFFTFLFVILGVIYGAVFFLKKGYAKKSKMGFLNSSELIKVVATHHIDPKKSIMIVGTGKQVFLLSSSETGVSLISELNEPMSYYKDGESFLFGDNFEHSIQESSAEDKKFQIKEDVKKSTPVTLSDSPVTKITDKIKNRVKGMKDFQ